LLDDTTGTDRAPRANDRALDELGIFWVSPVERFDRFRQRLCIGRGASSDVCLEGSNVSREHATIERNGPLWLLRDAASKNGVWVNSVRCDTAALEAHDTIRIGDWVGVVCSMPPTFDAAALFSSPAPGLLLSAPTMAALPSLKALAKRDIPIAIHGETGTGKDRVAAAIHGYSERPGRFVAVNCATLSETMADVLLFGHRKGAFTGAHAAGVGFVRSADRGTLLLDELSELPLAVQAKLLRVLEDRCVTPLGATTAERVDFRLIVACQEPLAQRVARGEFRGDLHARVLGAEIVLPPLRERKQEVHRLMRHFMAIEAGDTADLDSQFIEASCCYDWPYNIRELKQLAQLLALSGKPRLTAADLPEAFRQRASARGQGSAESTRRTAWLGRHSDEFQRLRQALTSCEGNVSRAALEAGIPRHRARRLLAAESERQDARRR
jgi:DNA-binding NtrC family response regulator